MSAENTINILIAEDQAIIRLGLKTALRVFPDIKVVAECEDGLAAVVDALALAPDVILMDIGLPKMDGITASRQIKRTLPGVHIIMFTSAEDDETIFAALSAGADGYCLKDVSAEHLYSAIKAVTRGVAWLDPGIADRVLRCRQIEIDKTLPHAQQIEPSGSEPLGNSQMRILRLLSQGADLDEVARQFNTSAESVAKLVNETIAKLHTSAAVHASRPMQGSIVLPIGTIFAERYLIESVLGRGGMGTVYKGKHLLMDRTVAIKMLHPHYLEDDLVVKRFQSEAKSLSGLSHPNLVTVFDFGITKSKEPYMVMDFHDGRGLDKYLVKYSKIDLGMAVNIFSQVCDALSAVHERNIVHRDIKPANIVISKDSLVKLVDFGIAKGIDGNAPNLTKAGEVVGTPRYMSPEQCMSIELDARSDIYSLGCVMYEVLAGHPPFGADSYYEIVCQHVNEAPPRFPSTQLRVDVSPVLEAIVLKTLAKDPGQRYQSASQLKRELQAAAFSA